MIQGKFVSLNLFFKHSRLHVSCLQNEPYKKRTSVPDSRKKGSWMFFLEDVVSLCVTHMENHLFSYMNREMCPGKENHSHKNSLSFTHRNKNSL